jgi:hypothetical protein
MGGGNVSKDTTAERNIAQSQVDLGNRLANDSEARTAKSDTLTQPLISYLQNIISGDRNAQTAAAAPQLGQLTKGFEASKENIFNTMPAGAGRDVALAQLGVSKNSDTSTLLNQVFQNAFPQLANIGNQQGAFALQQLGAGLRSTEGGSASTGQALQADSQAKASTMGFLGSLAGAGGQVAAAKFGG